MDLPEKWIETNVLDKLCEEADRSGKSINTLGNQILKFDVSWHSLAVDAGFVNIDKKNLSRIADKLTQNDR